MSHDLALNNIVRGRDVGLPTLNQARVALGLAPHASWADVTSNKHIQYRLQVAYEGFTVDDLERESALVWGLSDCLFVCLVGGWFC